MVISIKILLQSVDEYKELQVVRPRCDLWLSQVFIKSYKKNRVDTRVCDINEGMDMICSFVFVYVFVYISVSLC